MMKREKLLKLKWTRLFPVVIFLCISTVVYAESDQEIRKQMIQASIASYSGNCPCPYSLASNGSKCGKRSAYSKPGGYDPLCYEKDISDEMVKKWR